MSAIPPPGQADGVRDTEIKVVELGDDSPGAAVHHQASLLLEQIWGNSLVEPGLLRALTHAGNYVTGAYHDGELVGVSVGFFTAEGELHSHITGVSPAARGLGVGRALKLHQREWALNHGLHSVVWTFDPLVRRNAHFNLHVLGARPVQYLQDFYGPMRDELNDVSPSDRLYVVWDLDAPVPPAPASCAALVEEGAAVLLGPGEEHPARLPPQEKLLVLVPEDVERLRAQRPELTARLRFAVRESLEPAMAAGLRITGITPDGYYVLERGAA